MTTIHTRKKQAACRFEIAQKLIHSLGVLVRAREKKTKRQPAITNACVRRVGSQLLLFITADLRFTVSGAH